MFSGYFTAPAGPPDMLYYFILTIQERCLGTHADRTCSFKMDPRDSFPALEIDLIIENERAPKRRLSASVSASASSPKRWRSSSFGGVPMSLMSALGNYQRATKSSECRLKCAPHWNLPRCSLRRGLHPPVTCVMMSFTRTNTLIGHIRTLWSSPLSKTPTDLHLCET